MHYYVIKMHLNQEEQWLLREKYAGIENEVFRADLERLRSGKPLAYLIGHVPFLGCTIYLDSKPLIPRPETEYWVEKAIAEIKRSGGRVLDLCAGSGSIGVAVAKHCPEAKVVFAEIDPAHISTIKKNVSENLPTAHEVVESDLFENISGKFDFILSNPPYIDPALDRAEDSVREHEPHLALYGGDKGLELIDSTIAEAHLYMNEGGQLWIEHEPEQVEAIKESAATSDFKANVFPDQYGILRFSVLMR